MNAKNEMILSEFLLVTRWLSVGWHGDFSEFKNVVTTCVASADKISFLVRPRFHRTFEEQFSLMSARLLTSHSNFSSEREETRDRL